MLIKYDLIGATKAGNVSHPQTDFRSRGIEIRPDTYVGFEIGDFVVFQADDSTNLALLPSYTEVVGSDAGIAKRYYEILEARR